MIEMILLLVSVFTPLLERLFDCVASIWSA